MVNPITWIWRDKSLTFSHNLCSDVKSSKRPYAIIYLYKKKLNSHVNRRYACYPYVLEHTILNNKKRCLNLSRDAIKLLPNRVCEYSKGKIGQQVLSASLYNLYPGRCRRLFSDRIVRYQVICYINRCFNFVSANSLLYISSDFIIK